MKYQRNSLIVFIGLLWLVGLACSLPVLASQSPGGETPPAPTLPAEMPSATPPPATAQPVASPTPDNMVVKIFLIALEDGGVSGPAVGCGDSALAVNREIPSTTGVLRAALEDLLALDDQFFGESGLYNALYQSDLRVEGVALKDGTATVDLSGSLLLGGVCDSPRVKAQLEQTALQFSTVSRVVIRVNGVLLDEVLSLRGE